MRPARVFCGTARLIRQGIAPLIAALLLCSCGKQEGPPPVMPQLTARPQQYSAAGIHARVVDDRTADPIRGAVVLVLWRKIDAFRQTFGGVYVHHELVTDDDGTFEVPRWGPRTLSYDYYLDARDPEIWVMRRGYLLGYFDNTGALDPRVFQASGGVMAHTGISKAPPVHLLQTGPKQSYARAADSGSVWHGKTLALRRVDSPEEEARSLAQVILSNPTSSHEFR